MTIYNTDVAVRLLEDTKALLDDCVYNAGELGIDALLIQAEVLREDVEEYISLLDRFGE